jgi:SAM-dependent methyltransferase
MECLEPDLPMRAVKAVRKCAWEDHRIVTSQEAEVWGSAPWERLAATMGDIHDELVARLRPQPGERWLDIATGTGAVALRAARAGARVTAQDLAPRLIDTARRLAAQEGIRVRFDVGDAARLPYADSAFEVVSSAHGVSFVADHVAAANELARVCRPGGRLGLTDWLPDRYPEFEQMLARFRDPDRGGGVRRHDWGRREHVQRLLGNEFELTFFEGNSPWRGPSGEAIWQLYVTANGKAKRWVAGLPPARRSELHQAWVEYFESQRVAGEICAPRAYLVVIGRKHPAWPGLG